MGLTVSIRGTSVNDILYCFERYPLSEILDATELSEDTFHKRFALADPKIRKYTFDQLTQHHEKGTHSQVDCKDLKIRLHDRFDQATMALSRNLHEKGINIEWVTYNFLFVLFSDSKILILVMLSLLVSLANNSCWLPVCLRQPVNQLC